ncbi:hypothetical protein GCM10009557_44920 [Virgisporangium ochraceum]|uniref:Lipoprotein n=1 Tax=Virgisporangium ochraceum TaxID=65505 RepID=A0A8J3ZTC4_9ACTN|nr:hypothetical protein [Virgisporangium ochraceum]GIJ67688.1 hypothetical protein Voc01_026050 [Virgisporangium ochraceum]
MRRWALFTVLGLCLAAGTACTEQRALDDVKDACTFFGQLRVDREKVVVDRAEIERRLDEAVDAAGKAADKDAEWSNFERQLKDLRASAGDPQQYDQLESEIWTVCAPLVGT